MKTKQSQFHYLYNHFCGVKQSNLLKYIGNLKIFLKYILVHFLVQKLINYKMLLAW